MKKHILSLIFICFTISIFSQSIDKNYIKKTILKEPFELLPSDITFGTNGELIEIPEQLPLIDDNKKKINIHYYDDLGKLIQLIEYKQSTSGKNIVTHIEYDAFSRQTKDFLPYASQNASLNHINALTNVSELNTFYNSYNGGTNKPYSEKFLDASSLYRVLIQAAPGNEWSLSSGHEIKFNYETNTGNEVKLFKAATTWNASLGVYDISLSQSGNYQNNQLYKIITKDENWTFVSNNTSEEFKNKEGQIILKRSYNNINNVAEPHDTYYVYDQYGNLTYVIPPLVINPLTQLNDLCYQYKYDQRNRLVEKKLPGKQWEFIIYDKLDRPVAIGPVNTPFGGSTMGWLITQYDVFSRVTQTGWKQMTVSATTRNTNQQSINSGTNPFTLGTNDILTKNYYDNYAFPDAPTIPTSLPTSNFPIASNVKGMPTGSWVKVLDLSNSNSYELSYTIYDNKYRPVKSYTKNYLGGYTQIESNIDWAGKTLYTLTKHKRTIADEEITVKDMFSYSDQDRLLIHKQKINSLPEQLITSNTYDELGQLISKKVGGEDVSGGTGLQKVDYSYNIRGWLKSINDINDITTENDLFAFKLSYNDPETGQPLFNGNISESFWNTGAGNTIRKYNYTYDKLNRLLQADYSKQGNVTFNSYLEYLTYDKNGNIQTLIRNGGNDTDGFSSVNMIDNLIYTYHPTIKNQLMKVFDDTNSPQGFKDDSDGTSDLVDDYNYDSNGNMTKDDNKGITEIIYNHLNLPTKITFGTNGNIEYLYNAIGQKIRKKVNVLGSTSTDYLNGFQYKDNILKFFPHAEGYVNATESGAVFGGGTTYNYNYVFNYTDHLGNVRLSYGFDPATDQVKIIEQNHYYPFGLKHTNYNSDYLMYSKINESVKLKKPGPTQQVALAYQYKYQGQERQDELGLNWDSFKWRNYDYALGRFMSVDKLAEDYSQQSPYAFAENRVVDGREMEGLEWTSSTSSDGKTVNLNLNVRTVNNSNGIITNKQMGEISTQRAEQLNSSLGGVDSQGRTVNVSVTYSDKATVSWEYSMGNDTNGKTYSGSKAYDNEFGDQFADGLTHEIGNTQVNRTQVNVYQTGDKGVTLDVNTPEMTKTFAKRGAHEDGHVVGLRHEVGDVDNKLKDEQRKDPKNLMNEAPKGTNILPSQRSQVIDLIEKQQKK